MTDEQFASTLVPIAAELVGTVRDYGPDDVAAVLARVPEGRHDALAVVLAAMVNPDATPGELLAWTEAGPVQSRDEPRRVSQMKPGKALIAREHGTDRGYYQHRRRRDWPACGPCLEAHREVSRTAMRRARAAS